MDNVLRTCGKLVRSRWIRLWIGDWRPCGNRLRRAPTQSTGCAREKVGHILTAGFSTGKFTGRIDLPVENRCGRAVGWEFSPDSERKRLTLRRHADLARTGRKRARKTLRNKPRPGAPAGYHSPVCSATGDAIDRIVAAIDQLASDARDAKTRADESELTARIATLWQMVSDLDPELARRAQRYTGPVGGGPSD